MSTSSAMRSIDFSTNWLSIDIWSAFWGHASTQRLHPLHSVVMTARLLITLIALTKHTDSQVLQPTHASVTVMVTPGILVTLLPMSGARSGSIRHKQQHGQQLQIVSNLLSGPTFSQTASNLFLPIKWTKPASRHFFTCCNASSLVTFRPSSGLIFVAASPKKRHPNSIG